VAGHEDGEREWRRIDGSPPWTSSSCVSKTVTVAFAGVDRFICASDRNRRIYCGRIMRPTKSSIARASASAGGPCVRLRLHTGPGSLTTTQADGRHETTCVA
jgi:hypothetical protein